MYSLVNIRFLFVFYFFGCCTSRFCEMVLFKKAISFDYYSVVFNSDFEITLGGQTQGSNFSSILLSFIHIE